MDMQEDMIIMQDGKVMRMQDNNVVPLEEELTLADGTRVLVDGTLILTSGTTRMMREGETMRTVGRAADTTAIPPMGSTEEMTGTETHDLT
ncbi:MAG TPA: DUF6799 domain-containing protein [Anaerolineales bacterium]|nr:DUF6799 domain-containing protein [Anaerolineales bacterium]